MQWIIARLKEPSTWAGISALLIAWKILPNDMTTTSTITTVGMFIASALAMAFPEGQSK